MSDIEAWRPVVDEVPDEDTELVEASEGENADGGHLTVEVDVKEVTKIGDNHVLEEVSFRIKLSDGAKPEDLLKGMRTGLTARRGLAYAQPSVTTDPDRIRHIRELSGKVVDAEVIEEGDN